MKSFIPLSAIIVLAALALVGCNQNSPSNSTETPSPNSRMSDTNHMMGGAISNNSDNYNMAHTNAAPAANDATR